MAMDFKFASLEIIEKTAREMERILMLSSFIFDMLQSQKMEELMKK